MTYTVRARHWERGWKLYVGGVGVTQSRTLAAAEAMVRDYLRLDGHADWASADLVIAPDLDGLEQRASAARELTRRAERAQRDGARGVAGEGVATRVLAHPPDATEWSWTPSGKRRRRVMEMNVRVITT
jgi:hypothetical protein